MQYRNSAEVAIRSGRLTTEEESVLKALLDAGYARNGQPLGRDAAIPANDLAALLEELYYAGSAESEADADRRLEHCKRELRRIVNDLIIRHNIPVMSQAGPGGGYWMPATDDEIEQFHRAFNSRAMTGLMKASRGRKAAYADTMVQLTLGFEAPEGMELRRRLGAPLRASGPPAWVQVVTRLLDRVREDPQAYADQIHQLQEQYGDIFVPRHKVEQLRELSANLQRALAEMK